MTIYGYVKVNSEGGENGKEGYPYLFASKEQRNKAMYGDYVKTFDSMMEDGDIDDEMSSRMSEKEFMEEMGESDKPENDVFGVIQAYDHHVQYEPFVQAFEG